MLQAYAVIGANFGDEGKGLVTDYLAAKYTNTIVVLHNGGAQHAHTVTTPEGIEHVFSHIGSGTFTGADTYIAKQFICNPLLFKTRYEDLLTKIKVIPKIYIDKSCKFTTFYDMIINQAKELERGAVKHGSCGLGIYETISRYNDKSFKFKQEIISPYGISIGEFAALSYINKYEYLISLKKYYTEKRINQSKINTMPDYLELALNSTVAINNYIDAFEFMMKYCILVDDPTILNNYEHVIFENGQGLLLDQDNLEYYPHLTPSHTGLYNVDEILRECGYSGTIKAYFVSRTYMTRHGAGRFDSECSKNEINALMWDRTNVPNMFQDSLRYGKLDYNDLVNRVNLSLNQTIYTVEKSLVLTHFNEYQPRININKNDWTEILISDGYTRLSFK